MLPGYVTNAKGKQFSIMFKMGRIRNAYNGLGICDGMAIANCQPKQMLS